MSRGTAVVVIPVYKKELTQLELLSLSRCAAVLGGHPIVLTGPRSLDYGSCQAVLKTARVAPFDDRYFASLGAYSELLVSPPFYEAFAAHDYMLIYQPDAFVFEDQLQHWCSRGYDYIGAPWLGEDGGWSGVGNGGFSLRRIAACLAVLHSRRKVDPKVLWDHVRRTTPNPLIRAFKYHRKVLAHLGVASDVKWFLTKWVRRQEPEDMFWGLHAVRYHPAFRVAPAEEAVRFAVEAGLESAWPAFTERPPFGCHRSWYLEMLQRYLHGREEAAGPLEQRVWGLARAAGLIRPQPA